MSIIPPDARNVAFLQKRAKALKKQHRSNDPAAIEALMADNPDLATLRPDQVSTLELHQRDYQAAVARQFGFDNWRAMIGYAQGRPRREAGGIVISDKLNLTAEEALNDRASLHGMPPIGTTLTSEPGIEWNVVMYGFFPTPTTFARYPNDCDYRPIVLPDPDKMSCRLRDFINETDRCTSKRILFLDTMPATHPFKLGQGLHCANVSSNPEESYIYLDVAHAHETTIAHEIGHLWINYVERGDDIRLLRDRSDNGKVNQLDLVKSFVLDLKVNDLIAARGFDMSLIHNDEINCLTILRDAMTLGYKPPTPREALLNSLSIAGAILEQKRWPNEMKQRLSLLLEFYEEAAPAVHKSAIEFVDAIRRCGYNSPDSLRKALDKCIMRGFRVTGDDFDLERDLHEVTLTECMQDKHPEQFAGLPVPLKLEIGKTMARNGISGDGNIRVLVSIDGAALIAGEKDSGETFGPLRVNYQLVPSALLSTTDFLKLQRQRLGCETADEAYERVNGRSRPNPFATPDPASLFAGTNTADEIYFRINGRPRPGSSANPQNPTSSDHMPMIQPGQAGSFAPTYDTFGHQFPHNRNPMLPRPRGVDVTRRYMAGVGLAVARARLAQQLAKNGSNLYGYAGNNPVNSIDPSGLAPIGIPNAALAFALLPITDPGGGVTGDPCGTKKKKEPCNPLTFYNECKGNASPPSCCQQKCEDNCGGGVRGDANINACETACADLYGSGV